jgi:hypothetical protein
LSRIAGGQRPMALPEEALQEFEVN